MEVLIIRESYYFGGTTIGVPYVRKLPFEVSVVSAERLGLWISAC